MSPLLVTMAALTCLLLLPVLLRRSMVSEELALISGVSLALCLASVITSLQGGLTIESGSAATFQINGLQAMVSARIFLASAAVLMGSGLIWYSLPLRLRPAPLTSPGVLSELRLSSLEKVFSPTVIRMVAGALLIFTAVIMVSVGPIALGVLIGQVG